MDMEDFKNYYKRTETENIHWEIFKETPEYKNYTLGLAQGIYAIYDLINEFKDKIIDNNEWLKAIENVSTQDEKVGAYFQRLLSAKKNL